MIEDGGEFRESGEPVGRETSKERGDLSITEVVNNRCELCVGLGRAQHRFGHTDPIGTEMIVNVHQGFTNTA